jgi:hypothetical protein
MSLEALYSNFLLYNFPLMVLGVLSSKIKPQKYEAEHSHASNIVPRLRIVDLYLCIFMAFWQIY